MIKNSELMVLPEVKGSYLTYAFHIALGSIFLALISQIALPLPFTTVPLTFQTLGVLLLVMMQGKNKAFLSVIAYLFQASLGLPVLAGGIVNPLWMIGPRVGYLIGFAAEAYLVGYLLEKMQHCKGFWTVFSFATGELTTLTLGMLGLTLFIGFPNSLWMGFVPFLFNAVVKVCLACSFAGLFKSVK